MYRISGLFEESVRHRCEPITIIIMMIQLYKIFKMTVWLSRILFTWHLNCPREDLIQEPNLVETRVASISVIMQLNICKPCKLTKVMETSHRFMFAHISTVVIMSQRFLFDFDFESYLIVIFFIFLDNCLVQVSKWSFFRLSSIGSVWVSLRSLDWV